MLQAARQGAALHGEDEPAAAIEFLPFGNEGRGVDFACELSLRKREGEGNSCIALPALIKGIHGAALVLQKLDVDLPRRRTAQKGSALGKDAAVFGDHVVPREDEVGDGLPLPRVGIDVACDALARLRLDEQAPVFELAHRLVARREVDEDVRTRRGVPLRRGMGRPEILADLRRDGKGGHLLVIQDDLPPEGNGKTCVFDDGNALFGGRKVAKFVKFAVVGDMALGDERQKFSLREGSGAVEELRPHRDGHARKHERMLAGRSGNELL